jgi:hypothetical protein
MKHIGLALALVLLLVVGLVGSVSAAPKTTQVPTVSCQKHTDAASSWQRYRGDDSLVVTAYLRRWTDNAGTYCGYMQPYAYVSSDCGAGCSSEPIVAQYVEIFQADGLYLGGYGWTGLTYVDAWTGRWFAGPMTWVTCGSPVKAYSSAVEQYNTTGESDFGQTLPADGDSVGVFTVSVAPC